MTTDYKIPTEIPTEVFRTYDIRGEVGEDGINTDLAYAIARALASEAITHNRHSVIVGRDGRLSGPEIKPAVVQGLIDGGCDVIDIGVVPTPLVYFATNRLSTDCGIMVTASHNPKNHNGFKMVLAGKTLSTEGVQAIKRRVQDQDFSEGNGAYSQHDISADYLNYITSTVKLARPMKVVIDAGNGAASVLAPKLYRALGCELVELFCEMDGNFPNHHPDPTVPKNLETIIATVKETNAEIGIAFDGDADRIGVVTNRGEIIWPDRQMMLFAKDVLSRIPGSQIVFDVKCSNNLPKVIKEQGGKPIMFRTGHSLIKAKMNEINAPLAGEMSGHIFFKENWFGFDDGIYVGARLLRILSETNESSSEVFEKLPNSINTPELKLPMPENQKASFMQKLLTEADFADAERITIDGLRVDFGYGWGLVRPSNTSPNLILRFEADTTENLQKVQDIFRRELLKINSELQLPF